MIKKYLTESNKLIHEYGFLVLIILFAYIAVSITMLNTNLKIFSKSVNNLSFNNSQQNQSETVSVSEMMDRVNFRDEFNYIQQSLDDISTTLDIVEINTR